MTGAPGPHSTAAEEPRMREELLTGPRWGGCEKPGEEQGVQQAVPEYAQGGAGDVDLPGCAGRGPRAALA